MLLVIALASAITGITYSLYFRIPFPFRDMVEVMRFLDSNPSILIGDTFTKLHDMEHRPAFPGVIWYFDRMLFASNGLMPLILSQFALAVTSCLAVSKWAPQLQLRSPYSWLTYIAAIAAMFSLLNWYNLIWEKQLHMSMSLLFITLSSYFICKDKILKACKNNKISKNHFLSTGSALIATFSFGYGLPAILVITIHGLLSKWPTRQILFFFLISIITVLSYFYFLNLRDRGSFGFLVFPSEPLIFVENVARFLGAAIPASINSVRIMNGDPNQFALLVGIILIGFYGFRSFLIYYKSIFNNQKPTESQSFSLIITSICFTIAVMTCLARPEETQEITRRYYIISTFFIISLPGLFLDAKSRTTFMRRYRIILVTLTTIFVILSWFGHVNNFSQARSRWHSAAVAAIGADLGIYLPDGNGLIDPPLHQSEEKSFKVWTAHRSRLKKSGQYYPFEWLQKEVGRTFRIYKDPVCKFSIDWVKKPLNQNPAHAFSGALYHKKELFFAKWLVVTNPSGIIIGIGALGQKIYKQVNQTRELNVTTKDKNTKIIGGSGYFILKRKSPIIIYAIKGENGYKCKVERRYR